jgi:hypothetical protein
VRAQEDCGSHNPWQHADCIRPAGHDGDHRGHANGDGITVVWTAHTPWKD